MPSESGNRQSMGFPPPPQTEPLPCPRCDSVNTKFCYYNNYNLSQPRHFCKSCRRYWTQGGTLRDVPVGGGSRKNSKRSRFSSSASSSVSSASSSSSSSSFTNESLPVKSVSVLAGVNTEMGFNHHENHVNVNGGTGTGSFTTLLSSQSSGFLALGGYGYGSGPGTGSGGGGGNNGFDEMGCGLGRGLWSYSDVGDLVGSYGGGGPESSISGYNTWQQMNESEGGEGGGGGGGGGMVDGDLLAWPDLAISMQAKSLNLK